MVSLADRGCRGDDALLHPYCIFMGLEKEVFPDLEEPIQDIGHMQGTCLDRLAD